MKVVEENHDELKEPIIGWSIAAALEIFRSRSMLGQQSIRRGRYNDDKGIQKDPSKAEETVIKALDLYDKEGNLVSKKEKFRE